MLSSHISNLKEGKILDPWLSKIISITKNDGGIDQMDQYRDKESFEDNQL